VLISGDNTSAFAEDLPVAALVKAGLAEYHILVPSVLNVRPAALDRGPMSGGETRPAQLLPNLRIPNAPEVTTQMEPPVIPEPATLFLLGAGLLGAGFGARYFNSRASDRKSKSRSVHRRSPR
jgi:hypothetical protein